MSSALPQSGVPCCTVNCDEPIQVQVPGATGATGAAGSNGTNGVNAFTLATVAFNIPAELANVVATVADTSWMNISQKVYASRADGSVHAFFEVMAIGGATTVTLKNLEDTANNAYSENSAPGSTLNIGSKIMPAGIQGATGLLSGSAAGGDLKGTYPNPKIGIANTKGSILAGNGTDTVAIPAGTNGHMLAYDSTDAEGIVIFKALPLTGDADLVDNSILRANGGTGLPVPAQPSRVVITDTGAIQASGSGGNSRGTDAVDLQVNRSNATEVASGTESFLGGGDGNTVSGARAVCGGGDANIVSSTEGFVGGGESNQAITGDRAVVCGGQLNIASGTESFIGGGESNTATASHATVSGGNSNDATQQDATIGGGNANAASGNASTVGGGGTNTASGAGATVSGGSSNTASNTVSTVGGGATNTASGEGAVIPGGRGATADKYGQLSHASGFFASAGDCQTSELQWRIATSDATANVEMFLDGTAIRATIPSGTSWVFDILHVGRSSAGVTAAWRTVGSIQNNAGTTALVAAVTNTLIADGTGGTWGVVGNVPVVDADNGNDALRIRVTGAAVTNIRWTSIARLAQLQF